MNPRSLSRMVGGPAEAQQMVVAMITVSTINKVSK